MRCTCRASVFHNSDCPEYNRTVKKWCDFCRKVGDHNRDTCPFWVEVTDEERTLLAHYRGDCHNSADCQACKSDQGWLERKDRQDETIRSLQRRLDQMGSSSTLNREITRLEREAESLHISLASSNRTSAHRLRERQEAERQRDIAYEARDNALDQRDKALDDMQEVITGSREPETEPPKACPECYVVNGHRSWCWSQ